jgi:hypothetical protein
MRTKVLTAQPELTRAERTHLREALRYYSTEGVLKDFPSKRERAAMAALWKWLSLNGVVAWKTKKDPHVFDTIAAGPGRRRRWGMKTHAVVFKDQTWRAGETAFAEREPRRKRARRKTS